MASPPVTIGLTCAFTLDTYRFLIACLGWCVGLYKEWQTAAVNLHLHIWAWRPIRVDV